MNTIQSLSLRSLCTGAVGVAALSLAAFTPVVNASHHPYAGASLGVFGSANAVEHRLLSHLGADLGNDGSANAVEHRLLSHLGADLGNDGSANAEEHALAG